MRQKTHESRRLPSGRILAGVAVALLLLRGPLVADETKAGVETLSLDQALAIALRNNRLVRSAVLDVSRAEEKVGKARGCRWPTRDVTSQSVTTGPARRGSRRSPPMICPKIGRRQKTLR